MSVEIERKFLVASDEWREQAGDGEVIRQGYLIAEKKRSARVRLRAGKATLTLKGATRGAARSEFEYSIPPEDAAGILEELVVLPVIDKTRYLVKQGELTWEIDVFAGANEGLVIAEVELDREDQEVPRPPWLGDEVTGDPRYYNANLVHSPYSEW